MKSSIIIALLFAIPALGEGLDFIGNGQIVEFSADLKFKENNTPNKIGTGATFEIDKNQSLSDGLKRPDWCWLRVKNPVAANSKPIIFAGNKFRVRIAKEYITGGQRIYLTDSITGDDVMQMGCSRERVNSDVINYTPNELTKDVLFKSMKIKILADVVN